MLKIFTLPHKLTAVSVLTENDMVIKIAFGEDAGLAAWCAKRFRALPERTSADRETERQLSAYFNGELRQFDLPYRLIVGDFTGRVLQLLKRIPYGKVATYGEIAAGMGNPQAARAVGAACHSNPLPLLFPCHRVVGKNGKLTGFASGIELKRKLLELEGYSIGS